LVATRARRLGLLLLALALVPAVAVAIWTWRRGLVGSVLTVAVSPAVLIAVTVAVIVGAVLWCAGIILTARLAQLPGRLTPLRSVFAALCCLVVLAPSAVAVRYLGIQHGVIDAVFGGGKKITSDAADPWKDLPRVNVLLLGSDAGQDRVGVRTDSMMVASIDTKTGDTILFGVPRNLENAPIPSSNPLSQVYPDGYNCGDKCLLNGIWTLAEEHKDLFPQDVHPGLTSTRDVVGAVLGLPIQRVVVIDLKGFSSLVNAMGGVEINVKERVPTGGHVVNGQVVGISGWIEPGIQHLDGYHALWYARSRATTDDFSRMRRQRCVAAALVQQANAADLLARYPQLADVIKNNVTVEIPQSELSAWVTLVERIQKTGTISSLPITNKVVSVGNPDYEKIHRLVAEALTAQPKASPSPPSPSPSSTETGGPTPSAGPSGTPEPSPSPSDTLESIAATC
jgi:LCP family protein required for cell wall assembly